VLFLLQLAPLQLAPLWVYTMATKSYLKYDILVFQKGVSCDNLTHSPVGCHTPWGWMLLVCVNFDYGK